MDKKKSRYLCPVCGEEHSRRDICPVVNSNLEKMRQASHPSMMSGIILECIERDIDFVDIMRQIAYFMETLSAQQSMHNIVVKHFNADFVSCYFATVLECDVSRFYKKKKELADKYYKILDQLDVDSISSWASEDNEISSIEMELSQLSDTFLEGPDSVLRLMLVKEFDGRRAPTYYLRMTDCNPFDRHIYPHLKSHDPQNCSDFSAVRYKNIPSGGHYFDGYDLYTEKSGKFKDFFEDNFDWEEVAEEWECSLAEAHSLKEELQLATEKGLICWEIDNRKHMTEYSSDYAGKKIIVNIIHDIPSDYEDFDYHQAFGDSIYVYENERKMYHYGTPRAGFTLPPEIPETSGLTKIRWLRNLAETIKQCENDRVGNAHFDALKKINIKKNDVLAVTYSFECSRKKHVVKPCCGLVPVLDFNNQIVTEKLYLGYCRECDIYYVFRRDYTEICKKGQPQCKVIDKETKKVLSDVSFQFNDKSVLSEMGYNVQATSDLSVEERQKILMRAIDEGRISINEIINLLELQIHLHSENEKYRNAIEKWKQDVEFLKAFGLKSERKKVITTIQV